MYRLWCNRLNIGFTNQETPVQYSWGAEFFLSDIYTFTPNVVSVRSVKSGKSQRPIGGISVALKSAKGEIKVSENLTLGLRKW